MKELQSDMTLSPWWRRSVMLVFVCGMAVLIFMSVQAYRYEIFSGSVKVNSFDTGS